MGGAWNASIVAEYMKYRGQTLSTTGLGAAISRGDRNTETFTSWPPPWYHGGDRL